MDILLQIAMIRLRGREWERAKKANNHHEYGIKIGNRGKPLRERERKFEWKWKNLLEHADDVKRWMVMCKDYGYDEYSEEPSVKEEGELEVREG